MHFMMSTMCYCGDMHVFDDHGNFEPHTNPKTGAGCPPVETMKPCDHECYAAVPIHLVVAAKETTDEGADIKQTFVAP